MPRGREEEEHTVPHAVSGDWALDAAGSWALSVSLWVYHRRHEPALAASSSISEIARMASDDSAASGGRWRYCCLVAGSPLANRSYRCCPRRLSSSL